MDVAFARPIAALQFRSIARSHAGVRRPVNEDRVLDRCEVGLWAVADGMGGHLAGEKAAELLVEALDAADSRGPAHERLMRIAEQVRRTNADLYEQALDAQSAMGSTLVAFLAHGHHYACLWVGDSRAYRHRNGALTAISHDHSVVQELVDAGLLSEEDRRSHPRSNVITRAVGAAAFVELDEAFAPITCGDRFILCSDGLTNCVGEDQIGRIITGPHFEATADELLAAALANGAPDNVSFIIIEAF